MERPEKGSVGLGGVVMINVTYSFDECSLKIQGHADEYEVGKPFNAVCGMVSVLGECCLWGCLRYSDRVEIINRESGHLEFRCVPNSEVKAVMNTCIEGILQVKEQFPRCFGGVSNGA